ncbi:MAG: SGNH/GDSL hydrolase family protein [Nitrospirae bacterium]|nr:SGNH/GDSL hydrolase family protein [Nitrospirota bacterium]
MASRLKRQLLIQAGLAVVTLLALEAGARYFQASRGRSFEDALYGTNYRDYFFLGPSFKPNSEGPAQGLDHVKINSLGFRGEEISIQKPAGTYRIVTFGGSTSHSGNYPAKLGTLLKNHKIPGYDRVEVVNVAVPAWNTTQSLVQFITRAIYLEPDFILVFHAINDFQNEEYKWLKKLPAVDYAKYSGFVENHSLLYNFARNRLRRIRDGLQGKKARAEMLTLHKMDPTVSKPSPKIYTMNLTNFLVLASHHGIKAGLITMPMNYDPAADLGTNFPRAGGFAHSGLPLIVEMVSKYNQIQRELASKFGVLLIDVERMSFTNPAYYTDLVHFSEDGAQKFAEIVAAHVERALAAPAH